MPSAAASGSNVGDSPQNVFTFRGPAQIVVCTDVGGKDDTP